MIGRQDRTRESWLVLPHRTVCKDNVASTQHAKPPARLIGMSRANGMKGTRLHHGPVALKIRCRSGIWLRVAPKNILIAEGMRRLAYRRGGALLTRVYRRTAHD
jgi:hypothetical protein